MIDNISKLRKVQLELLTEFKRVCEEHDLKWYAFFGTLLGIMRGEGYLPWDDDVDVAMPMDDYLTLCRNPGWFDTESVYLQTPLDSGSPRYAKLRRNGTTAFRSDFIDELRTCGHHGIPIDIIPLSELPGMECYQTPCLMSADKKEAVYLKEWFEPAGTGIFEGLTVRTPAFPRKILNEVYDAWNWPHGVRESRPSYWFFDTETDYEVYYKRYTGMLENIEGKKIFLFGAADSLRIWLERFDCRDQVVYAFDNDPKKWNTRAYDVEIRNPQELPGLMDVDSRVIIVSLWHQEIGRQLEKMGISDYFVYLDEYYDEKVGNKVIRREYMTDGENKIPVWN